MEWNGHWKEISSRNSSLTNFPLIDVRFFSWERGQCYEDDKTHWNTLNHTEWKRQDPLHDISLCSPAVEIDLRDHRNVSQGNQSSMAGKTFSLVRQRGRKHTGGLRISHQELWGSVTKCSRVINWTVVSWLRALFGKYTRGKIPPKKLWKIIFYYRFLRCNRSVFLFVFVGFLPRMNENH